MRATKKLSVPDLTRLSLKNAKLLLETLGFVEPDVLYEESYEAPLTVIDQQPVRGSVLSSTEPVKLFVSQQSFIDYLPGVYRSSVAQGAYTLKNFLWVFRHFYDQLSDKIDNIPRLFRPYETPPEFLGWLSRWVGFVMDENWPEDKKRQLLRSASEYYKVRGTVKGLTLYLSHFVNVEPRIIENKWPFKGFQIDVHSTMDVDSIIFPPINKSHCFVVSIPIDVKDADDQLIIKVHDIIRAEKPAHAVYYLRFKHEAQQLTEFQIVIGDGDSGGYVIGEGEEIKRRVIEDDVDYILEDDEEEAEGSP
jgi:phage tail-like protein